MRQVKAGFGLLLGLGAVILPGCQSESPQSIAKVAIRPNFIIIFCDDLGYGDVALFGPSPNRTPNLDRMAAEGRKFTQFYATSGVCSPSRSSMMTGCYPKRVGMHKGPEGEQRSPFAFHSLVLFPGSGRGLNPDEETVAEALKRVGYATEAIGKWHLGDQPPFLPTRQGFDSYFGIPFSNDMGKEARPERGFPPLPLMRDEKVIETEPDQSLLTRRYTEEAVAFLKSHSDTPFFLYLAHTMPHFPIHASAEFRGRSPNGLYGDVVEELDWSTGRILQTLKELDLDERTLVIFTSDNGAIDRWGGSNAPLRGDKGTSWEGGMRVPALMRWPGQIPAGTESKQIVTVLDLKPTLLKLAGAQSETKGIVDGKDLWQVISGDGAGPQRDRFYYYEMGYLAAVRLGKWKLHLGKLAYRHKEFIWEPSMELYDLDSDPEESIDRLEEEPEIVKRIEEVVQEARRDLGDDATGDEGANVRPAGWVDGAVTLTSD